MFPHTMQIFIAQASEISFLQQNLFHEFIFVIKMFQSPELSTAVGAFMHQESKF